MTEPPTIDPAFEEALDAGDTDRLEELWLAALDEPPIAIDELLEVRRRLWQNGDRQLARTLLELLADTLEADKAHDAAVRVLAELVRLADKPEPTVVARLESSFAASREDSPSLRQVLARHPIRDVRRPLEVLAAWQTWLDNDVGTVVEVTGQGVGRVVDLNLELETIKVDVGDRRPVSVPFGAASRFLRRLPEGDFRRRKVEDPFALRSAVLERPGESLAELLSSFSEPADVAAIRGALDGLVEPAEWTTWWGKARGHSRIVTSGSGSRLRYSVSSSAESAVDALLGELAAAEPRQRLAVARRLAARGAEAAAAAASVLERGLATLETADPGLAWETAAVLRSLPGGPEPAGECRCRLIATARPLQILTGIQDRAERLEALSELRSATASGWPEIWAEWLLHEQSPQVLDHLARELVAGGHGELLDATIEAVFRSHTEHPAQFVWACERMTAEDAPEALMRRLTASLLEKLPDTLTRAEFGPLRARAKSLLDGGQVAIRLILEVATAQQAERFVGRMQRVSTLEPQRLRLLEQAVRQVDTGSREVSLPLFVATRPAIERKRSELRQLLDVDIPRTLKGIQAAAAEGDLRENFEYHMLRDRQELQSARAAKLQQDLAQVQVLEPGSADTSVVNIGTVVRLADPQGSAAEPITILGSWDADVERRVFANGSGVAQSLLGKRVGDEVELEGRTLTVLRIDPWTGG